MIKPKAVLLIFVSRKITLTDAKVGVEFLIHDRALLSFDMGGIGENMHHVY